MNLLMLFLLSLGWMVEGFDLAYAEEGFRTRPDEEVITYTRPDGGVSVVVPSLDCLDQLQTTEVLPGNLSYCPPLGLTKSQALDWIQAKSIRPEDQATNIRRIKRWDGSLPVSRNRREAWRQQPDGTIVDDFTIQTGEERRRANEQAIRGKLGLTPDEFQTLRDSLQ